MAIIIVEIGKNGNQQQDIASSVVDLTKITLEDMDYAEDNGNIFEDTEISIEALNAARAFYYAPMGLLYSVNNCYHETAIIDMARELDKFASARGKT